MSDINRENTAQSTQVTEEGRKFLTFFLDHEEYGIQILTVREIIGLQPVTTIPRAPDYIRGIINLRGGVIPVVDLRTRFEMESVEDTDETCIIVVQSGDSHLGVVVDRVSEVLEIPESDIVDPPSMGKEGSTDHLLGIGKHQGRVTLLLDLAEVFPTSEIEGLNLAA